MCSTPKRATPSEKKALETASKSGNNRQRNACSNYALLERTVLRTRSVTNKTRKQEHHLQGNAVGSYGQDIATRTPITQVELTITILIVTIRSIWHNSAADFFFCFFLKISTANLRILWRHLRRNYETFSALQRTSGPLADDENCVQIHAQLATLSFIKLVNIDQKMRSGIWRFAVAPSEAAQTRSSADADNRLDAFSGQSRSTNMVPFHMLHIVSYCAIVT